MGIVESVNVGRARQIAVRRGRPVMSAIGKAPVEGRVRIEGIHVDGDEQADMRVHGGPDKAVYAYALEDTAWWAEELERELGVGAFGENLSVRGVEVTRAVIGERWRVGTATLEVCQPRQPCSKLGMKFGTQTMVKRFALASRPGAYLRILEPGDVAAGDAVELLDRPEHGVTIELVSRALLLDGRLLGAAAVAPQLPQSLADWMRERA